jgi:hypothetical protein
MDNEWTYVPARGAPLGGGGASASAEGYYTLAASSTSSAAEGPALPLSLCRGMDEVLAWYADHALEAAVCRYKQAAREERWGEEEVGGAGDLADSDSDSGAGSDSADDDKDAAAAGNHGPSRSFEGLSSTFCLPVGAFQCLHTLAALTGRAGFLLLCADKGFSNASAFAGAADPDIHVHGSFSMMVNFHALCRFVAVGLPAAGDSLVTSDDDTVLKVGAFLHLPPCATRGGGDRAWTFRDDLPLFTDTFRDRLERFGPAEFWDMQSAFAEPLAKGERRPERPAARGPRGAPSGGSGRRVLGYYDSDSDGGEGEGEDAATALGKGRGDSAAAAAVAALAPSGDQAAPAASPPASLGPVSVRAAVALCRLSDWDADVFYKFRDLFASRLLSLSPPRRRQILDGVGRMLDRAFPSPGAIAEHDPYFEAGRLHYLTGDHKRALRLFLTSLAAAGDNKATLFNVGMCCYHLRQYAHARTWLLRAIDCAREKGEGEYAVARSWLETCDEELLVEEQEGDADAAAADGGSDAAAGVAARTASPTAVQGEEGAGLRRLVLPGGLGRNVRLYI